MLNANARNCFCLCLILLLGMDSFNALAKGQTTQVSVATGGGQGNGCWSLYSNRSGDGRYVVFESSASNLVTGDTNAHDDIFVHDRLTKQTTRVNVTTGGAQANFAGESPSLSADGRYVVFSSFASNLVTGDTNNTYDETFARTAETAVEWSKADFF